MELLDWSEDPYGMKEIFMGYENLINFIVHFLILFIYYIFYVFFIFKISSSW